MPLYEFYCNNPACEAHEEIFDAQVRIKDRDTQECAFCKGVLLRKVSAPRTKHVSWSTWRI